MCCCTPKALCQQTLGKSRRRPGLQRLAGEDGRATQQQGTVREDPGAAGAHSQRERENEDSPGEPQRAVESVSLHKRGGRRLVTMLHRFQRIG